MDTPGIGRGSLGIRRAQFGNHWSRIFVSLCNTEKQYGAGQG